MTTNRNPLKQLFITFPKSTVDKSIFRDSLLVFDPDYYKIVEEKHQDGSPHLHAVLRLKKKLTKSKVLKKLKESYPEDYKRIDVQSVRSIKHALAYLSKEDPNPLTTGEFKSNRDPQGNMYLKFIRELGYDTLEELIAGTSYRQDLEERFRNHIVKFELDYLKKYGKVPLEEMSYKVTRARSRFLENIWISKDDMTNLMKVYNFKED